MKHPTQQDCFHCGLPVPTHADYAVDIDGQQEPMCCLGCQAVAQAIVDNGLVDFYRHREGSTHKPEDLVPEALQRMQLYDQPSLQASFVRTDEKQLKHAALMLEGITCAACIWLNERHVGALPGVKEFQVNYSTHRAHLVWDDKQIKLSDVLKAITAIGYSAHPFDPGRQEQIQKKEKSLALRRLFVAGLGTMQVMMLAIAMYAGDYSGMDEGIEHFMRWVSLLLTMPVVLYSARSFFVVAWRDIQRWRLSMEIPVSLAISAAFMASLWHTLVGEGDIYFDSVCMFTFFLLASRYLEMAARHKAGQAAEALVKLLPAMATRIGQAGEHEVVAVSQLAVGDRVLIRPGETVPADGEIVEGESSIDESLLTGESMPQTRGLGDTLVGGSLNVESPLQMRITSVGEDTKVSGIVRLLDRAQREKPRFARLADQVAGYFVAGLLLLAVLVAGFWWWLDPSRVFQITLAVLVVTCPCALSLATPVAVTAATGALTRLGLLNTRGHVLEALAKADHMVFDKTGTLTQGSLSLSKVQVFAELPKSQVLAIAASLSRDSEHPVARVLVAHGGQLPVEQLTAKPGNGMQGVIDGETYRLGRAAFVAGLTPGEVPKLEQQTTASRVYLANRQQVLAAFDLNDSLRPDAQAALKALQALGLHTHIFSGDSLQTVASVAQQLGVDDFTGDMQPDDKLSALKHLQANGHKVVMVGDGVNDAPVLAGADVSIAMGQSTQLAHASADMVVLSERLAALPAGIKKARDTHKLIKQNLTWALLYNVFAVPLAASGMLAPWAAALGMSLSSLIVVLNALRLK